MPVREINARPRVRARPKTDRELVRGCIRGREEDWDLLIDRYKNLIFSVPIRYGFSREEAADIFQAVCLALLQELPKLRDPQALPRWLIQVASHRCFQTQRQGRRTVSREDEGVKLPEPAEPPLAELNLRELEQEQMLREVVAALPDRCRSLVHMLFYEEPRRPYQEIAAGLGLATGSIGLLRQKCLERLREKLESMGFS